jgi:hypothetical protein
LARANQALQAAAWRTCCAALPALPSACRARPLRRRVQEGGLDGNFSPAQQL